MGLWGSKQQKDVAIANPESIGQVFVTEDALKNVIKTVESDTAPKKDVKESTNQPSLSADLYDKRLIEYESNLTKGFNEASRDVEELFRDRYRTLPVCADLQNKVAACYEANAQAPLRCVDVAQEFVKCVERERQAKFGLPPTSTAKLSPAS